MGEMNTKMNNRFRKSSKDIKKDSISRNSLEFGFVQPEDAASNVIDYSLTNSDSSGHPEHEWKVLTLFWWRKHLFIRSKQNLFVKFN